MLVMSKLSEPPIKDTLNKGHIEKPLYKEHTLSPNVPLSYYNTSTFLTSEERTTSL